MVQVEEKRLAELLREEWKLNALKNGGVEEWEWYYTSLIPDYGKNIIDIENTSDEKIIEDYL